MSGKITRYDLDENAEGEGTNMVRHPQGDYVEYSDHEETVDDLQARIDTLQKIVNEIFDLVRGEAA